MFDMWLISNAQVLPFKNTLPCEVCRVSDDSRLVFVYVTFCRYIEVNKQRLVTNCFIANSALLSLS